MKILHNKLFKRLIFNANVREEYKIELDIKIVLVLYFVIDNHGGR